MSISKEMRKEIESGGDIEIKSLFPIDPYGCDCQELISHIKRNPLETKYIECPKSKKGYTKYEVTCANCGEKIAELYSTDKSLTDWCDLHYFCKATLDGWRGCMSVNISPFDGTLGFECVCGQDTRDFRGNTTLKVSDKDKKIKENNMGKRFNQKDSKFKIRRIK